MFDGDKLRAVPLFDGLTDAELQALDACLGRRVFGPGVFIFHKGSPGRVLYIIESGLVRLFVISDLGQEISLNVHGPGEVFGELAVLDGRPRSTGALALETTVTRTLHGQDLMGLLKTSPRLATNLMELLVARLRYTTRYVEDLAFLDVQSRVAVRLLDLADRGGPQQSDIEIDLSLTQSELGTWVAASRESVNKVLATFRANGLIALSGSRITILDRRRLEQEIRF
jgi:CRP/FNR family cyclic AMP-dependent transcriptional regulator